MAEIIQFIPKAKPEPTLLEGAEIKAAEFLARAPGLTCGIDLGWPATDAVWPLPSPGKDSS